MLLKVRERNIELGREWRSFIERRLGFVLGRFDNRIARVTIHLVEQSSPHEAKSRRCRIVVRLVPSGQVSEEDADADLALVINRVIDRIGPLVRRELERRREKAGHSASRRHNLPP